MSSSRTRDLLVRSARSRARVGVRVLAAVSCLTSLLVAGRARAQSASTSTDKSGAHRKSGPHAAGSHADAHTPARASSKRTTATTPAHHTPVVHATPAGATTADAAAAPIAGALVSNGAVVLRDAPDGHPLATAGAATPLLPLARERGWVRVRVDGWIRDDGLTPAGETVGALSAADLRADPQGARGKVVRWTVQVLALARADALHRDLVSDEPYLLARGPGSENALLYVAVPPALLASATTLSAASPVEATIVATVRNGRSAPTGVPILDAQSLVRQ
jgi:hypothetical protein